MDWSEVIAADGYDGLGLCPECCRDLTDGVVCPCGELEPFTEWLFHE